VVHQIESLGRLLEDYRPKLDVKPLPAGRQLLLHRDVKWKNRKQLLGKEFKKGSPVRRFILIVRRNLFKKNRTKMLLTRPATLGLAAFLCTTAYGQCKVEKGEFYLLGADPVTLYYDVELQDVAQSKAIENFDEKSTDDSDYFFPNPTVCGEGKGRVVRWPLPNSHLSMYFPFSKLGVTLGLYARRRAAEDLRSKEREKRSVTYALLRRDEQKNLNDDIRRLKRILGRH